ncbi:MAG: hypothetical protein IPM34_02600 [Saprospiraceae bacterium]|nr:hypothetical protein [Saprospiraceae bacterium]
MRSAEIAAMDWLIHAARRTQYKGIPHSRWFFLPEFIAWKAAYPETSGYLLENLIERNLIYPQVQYKIAKETGDWLLNQQSQQGYFYSGLEKKRVSAFNSAQIMFGLHKLNCIWPDEKYRLSLLKVHSWLLQNIREDGSWKEGLYVKSWFPVYYAHALWRLLEIDMHYTLGQNLDILKKTYALLAHKAESDLYGQCGFFPNLPCLSHTLAYGLEGLLGCAQILNDSDQKNRVFEKLYDINKRSLVYNSIPAEFSSDQHWNVSYICTTGLAQFTSLYYQMYHFTNDQLAKSAGDYWLNFLLKIQIHSKNPGTRGAFPASHPMYKTYFPFRIVNWTQKFFLDACWWREPCQLRRFDP